MKLLRPSLHVCERVTTLAHRSKARFIVTVALTSLLSGSFVSLTGCKGQKLDIGPSTGEVVGAIVGVVAVVGVTTAVLVHVNHSHHQVKGCVSSGPNGLEVQTEGKTTWLLTGNTQGVPVGNLVKFHGTKVKRAKGSTGEPTFAVESLRKNYGACKAAPAATARLLDQEPPARAE